MMSRGQLAELRLAMYDAENNYCNKKGLNRKELTPEQKNKMSKAINNRKWFKEFHKEYMQKMMGKIRELQALKEKK